MRDREVQRTAGAVAPPSNLLRRAVLRQRAFVLSGRVAKVACAMNIPIALARGIGGVGAVAAVPLQCRARALASGARPGQQSGRWPPAGAKLASSGDTGWIQSGLKGPI